MCLKHGETVWNLLSSVELSWAQLSSVELHSDAWRQQFQLLPSMAGVPCMVVKMQDRVEPAVPPRQYAQIVGVCWKITECQTSGGGKKSVCSYHVQLTWSICPFSSCFRSLLDSFALGSSRGSNGDLPAVVSSSVLLCLRCYPGSTEHPTIAAIAPRLQCRADADHQEGCSPSLERKKTKVGFISSLLFMVVYGWYWHVWNTYIPQEVWGRKDSRISLICRVSIVPVLVPAQHRHVKNALNFQPIVGPGSLAPCSTEDSSIQCELRNKGAHTHTHRQTAKITTSFKRDFAGSINGRSQLIEILQKQTSPAISRSVQQCGILANSAEMTGTIAPVHQGEPSIWHVLLCN